MDLGLSGKTAIITGATANIGRAIALDFASEGARLILVGRDEEAGAGVSELARERGAAEARFLREDLLDEAAPARIVEAAGEVDVLINNVGGNVGAGLFAGSDPATWQGDIDLNLSTVLRMTHAVLPGMIERRAGRIVNIGSTAGIVGDYQLAVYSAAKAAVHGFTKVLAKEVGQHGITVNAVAPYGTIAEDPAAFSSGSRFRTGFFQQAFAGSSDHDNAMRRRKGPLERQLAKPEEVSAAVMWLASNRTDFVTGQVVTVDGGTLL